MRGLAALTVVLALAAPAGGCSAQADARSPDGISAWRRGRYEEAIRLLADAARGPDGDWRVRRAHVHVLLETTQLEQAEGVAAAYASESPVDSALVGDVAAARGALDRAERAYRAALSAGSPDSARVLAALGGVLAARGDWEQAHAVDERAVRAGRASEDADALITVAEAHARAGRQDPQRFRDALAVLDAALAATPDHPGVQAALADLFLEKYNAPDAREAAVAALEINPRHPRALLAEARRRRFEHQTGADSLVRLALEVAPNSMRAHALAGVLALDAEDAEAAARAASSALAIDATDVEALAVLAAAHLLAGDERALRDVERRARARGAAAGRFFAILAEHAARMRRYAQAVDFALAGTRADPREWRAHALAGVNRLRVGEVDSARASLERAFAGDPYDPWTKNTLDLLDGYDRFEERRQGRFVLLVEREEADLIAPYLHELLAAAYDSLSRRYDYEPAGPIRLEVYRRHADFAVRTVGLAELGALGVSFGDVLAMDSPAARRPGEFHFGATAWHELAHTFTLGASRGRVPRWLSEGISVYEERRARPGWGARPDPAMLTAYASGELPPPSRLGEVFARPGTAVRLGQAYVLASLVAEYIAERHGEQALASLVRAFADDVSHEVAFQRALRLTPDALDSGFATWMRARYPELLNDATPRSVHALLASREEGARLLQSGRPREAIEPMRRAVQALPDYGGADSPRRLLADAQLALGDTAAAIVTLSEHTALAETDLDANLQLATLHEARGDTAGALPALERAVWLMPYDPTIHERLARNAAATGNHVLAVRERRALLALAPTDRAGAHYELARALRDAGDRVEARREVLRALELAPNFARAQDLLLELRATPGTPESPR